MALREGSEKTTMDRLQQVRESYVVALASTVENCRWLATLVLAEMAGIAAYRSNVIKKETLGPGFAIVIIILGVSLATFVLSVLLARFERNGFEKLLGGVIVRMVELARTLTKDEKKAPADSAQELFAKTEEAIQHLPSPLGKAGGLELVGVSLLGIGSCLAALALFFGEISALFWKT
jgi:hypothetical protein